MSAVLLERAQQESTRTLHRPELYRPRASLDERWGRQAYGLLAPQRGLYYSPGGGRYAIQQAPAGFTPSALTNPILWLDASDVATITSSSGLVTQWNDKFSHANHVKASGTNRPTTGSATENGLNALLWNGTSTSMSITTGFSGVADQISVIAVARDTGGDPGTHYITRPVGTSAAIRMWNQLNDGSGHMSSNLNDDSGSSTNAKTNAVPGTTIHMFGLHVDVAGGHYYSSIDGVEGTAAVGNITAGHHVTLTKVFVGSSDTLGQFWNGTISELIITGTSMRVGSADYTNLHTYLSAKWGSP